MLEARESIGAWVNRFYLGGVDRIKDQVFLKQLRGGIRKRHPEAKQHARAWRRGLTLYPSEVQQGRIVLAKLLSQTSSRGARFTINRKRPTLVAPILDPKSEQRANGSRRRVKIPIYSNRDRDAGSRIIYPQWILDFLAKGTKNPRDQGD
jgi:hypothetical protein